ncbi:MAG TPA: signal peptidase I, partial [Pirellulales bacterium]
MSKKLEPTKSAPGIMSVDTAAWVRTVRETVESVVIAFILAFMFRTFEAEAFVIPTGSMAPTLQGRHKDIVCPQCGYEYRAGASEEVERESGALKEEKNRDTGVLQPACPMTFATCPMCRYTVGVDSTEYPSYNGDRIIVNKFAYSVSDPQRWDVVVFKYPQNSKENYIKRLVGLPNEHIELHKGDVYVAPSGSDKLQIARKPPEKLAYTLQPVYNNDYVVPKLIQAGMPPRWQPWTPTGTPSPWKTSEDFKSFSADETAPGTAWLRYQHLLSDEAIWDDVKQRRPFQPPPPSLIRDYYAYNEGEFPDHCDRSPPATSVWVGDLALECTVNVKKAAGLVILELVKGGRQFRSQIDLNTGEARLSISGKQDFGPSAKTAIHGPGSYELRFANVDEQLLLWVNNTLIDFNAPTTYDDLKNNVPVQVRPVTGAETPTDLSPVGIAVQDGASVDVSHLNIRRDIYYL